MAAGNELPSGPDEGIAPRPGEVPVAPLPDDDLSPLPDDRIRIPDDDIAVLPDDPRPPDQVPEQPVPPRQPLPDDDELRIALERARLIADDLGSVLRPVVEALRDGAWVSRRADEFSLELDDNARQLAAIGERGVEAIEELAQRGRPEDDGLDLLPHYPLQPPGGPVAAYDTGIGG